MCKFLEYIKTNPEIVILGITTIILFFTAIATTKSWKTSKNVAGIQLFKELVIDYRSSEMLHAIVKLKDIFDKCGREKNLLIKRYIEMLKEDPQSQLHEQRRIVTHFYSMMALLYVKEWIPNDMVHTNWSEFDLRIIPEILVPIETIAIPRLYKRPDILQKKYPKTVKNMMKLYNDSKKLSDLHE